MRLGRRTYLRALPRLISHQVTYVRINSPVEDAVTVVVAAVAAAEVMEELAIVPY